MTTKHDTTPAERNEVRCALAHKLDAIQQRLAVGSSRMVSIQRTMLECAKDIEGVAAELRCSIEEEP